MMMVMMVMVFTFVEGDVTVAGRTFLALCFQLQCGVTNAVVGQFVTDGCFDGMAIGVGDDVHGGTVVPFVHAPQVDMMHIQYPRDFGKMVLDGLHIHIVRGFFQKIGEGVIERFGGMDADEQNQLPEHKSS